MVGRKPKFSPHELAPVRESIARRQAEPSFAELARRLGCSPTTLRAAIKGKHKHYRERP